MARHPIHLFYITHDFLGISGRVPIRVINGTELKLITILYLLGNTLMTDLSLLDLILMVVGSYSYLDFSYTVLILYMYVYLSQAHTYFDLP